VVVFKFLPVFGEFQLIHDLAQTEQCLFSAALLAQDHEIVEHVRVNRDFDVKKTLRSDYPC
jgi:hypothetical protein